MISVRGGGGHRRNPPLGIAHSAGVAKKRRGRGLNSGAVMATGRACVCRCARLLSAKGQGRYKRAKISRVRFRPAPPQEAPRSRPLSLSLLTYLIYTAKKS